MVLPSRALSERRRTHDRIAVSTPKSFTPAVETTLPFKLTSKAIIGRSVMANVCDDVRGPARRVALVKRHGQWRYYAALIFTSLQKRRVLLRARSARVLTSNMAEPSLRRPGAAP